MIDKVANKFFPKIYETILVNLIQDAGQSEKVLEVATGTGILSIKFSDRAFFKFSAYIYALSTIQQIY